MARNRKKNKGNRDNRFTYRTFKNNNANKIDDKFLNGRKNATILPEFVKLCKMSQEDLEKYLYNKLRYSSYEKIISRPGFLYAKGNIPLLLTAHLDTVHKELVVDTYEYEENGKHYIMSPQGIGGDDRCGVWIILELLKNNSDSLPYILFCEDEEIGGIGSAQFTSTEYINDLKNMKYLIELDRANEKDAVFYDCDNDEFTNFITEATGYKEEWGTFSDISHIAPECGVAAVNLSCGYYKAHTTSEYVVIEEMIHTKNVVASLMMDIDDAKEYEYVERKYSSFSYYGGSFSKKEKDDIVLYVEYYNENTKSVDYLTERQDSIDACWRWLFINNEWLSYSMVLNYGYDYVVDQLV